MHYFNPEVLQRAEANYWTFRICGEWPNDCSDEMKELAVRIGRDYC